MDKAGAIKGLHRLLQSRLHYDDATDCFCSNGDFWHSQDAKELGFEVENTVRGALLGITRDQVRAKAVSLLLVAFDASAVVQPLRGVLNLLGYQSTVEMLKAEHDHMMQGHSDARELGGFGFCRLLAIENLLSGIEKGSISLP
jgi:hypothetical protein